MCRTSLGDSTPSERKSEATASNSGDEPMFDLQKDKSRLYRLQVVDVQHVLRCTMKLVNR